MNVFRARTQTFQTKSISRKKVCMWLELETEDIRITVDGKKTDNTLQITVEANGVRYMLTDVLLEMMLGKVAEEYSNEFLTFNVYQHGVD